jgi:hypothetical protein
VSDDDCDGAEEPWNSLAMSALPSAGFVGAGVIEVVGKDVAGMVDGDVTFEKAEVDEAAGRAGNFEDPMVATEARGLPLT